MRTASFRWLAFACLAACASSEASGASNDLAFPGEPSGGDRSPTTAAGASSDAGVPEKELESLYEAPIATGRYVWTANPRSGRVALVDVTQLSVTTVEAGDQPTTLGALPPACAAPCEDDRVVVLNVGSKDATLIAVTNGTPAAAATLKTPSGGNRWAISGDGRWAIAWTDARKIPKADKTLGFQDLTVLDLVSRTSTALSVGYRPVAIGFASSNARAFAVTQDGISILDLPATGAPSVKRNVPISDTPLDDPGTQDVALTPDGAYALVRRDDVADITIVSLDTGERRKVTLDGPVTDLDLSPSGDRAVAVVRSTATVAVLPLPGIWSALGTFSKITLTGETVGAVSLAPTGTRGILYTTVDPTIERLSVLDLSPLAAHTVRLHSPVLAAFLSPDGTEGLVLHPPAPSGSGQVAAFSLVPLSPDLPAKIVATLAPAMNVAFAPESDRAVVTERDDRTKIFGVYVARFPALSYDRYPLASPPIAAGIAARARKAYVAQEHPEGRITFIDLESGQARTLTGFELAARVVDGSQAR